MSRKATFTGLPDDLKPLVVSFLSGNEQVDLLFALYEAKEKKLLHILGRFMINASREEQNFGPSPGHYIAQRATLLIQLCTIYWNPRKNPGEEMDMKLLNWILGMPQIDVNLRNKFDNTALTYSIYQGHTALAHSLLKTGKCDVDNVTSIGSNALTLAVDGGYTDIALLLIKMKCELNVEAPLPVGVGSMSKATALVKCVMYRVQDVVKMDGIIPTKPDRLAIVHALIEAGADLDIADKFGCPALIHACGEGHQEIADALILAGADVNIVRDKTALTMAASKGYTEIVSSLLKCGRCDVDQRSGPFGKTALHWAAWIGNKDIVAALLEAGASVHEGSTYERFGTDYGYTPMHYAVQTGHLDIVQLLLQHHVPTPINSVTNSGFTALMMSARDGRIEIFQALLNAGAKINWEDITGPRDEGAKLPSRTAVGEAALGGELKIIESMIENGAHLDAVNEDGDTALLEAIRCKHADIAIALMNAGCDVHIKNKKGITAMRQVRMNQKVKVMEEERNGGANFGAVVWSWFVSDPNQRIMDALKARGVVEPQRLL